MGLWNVLAFIPMLALAIMHIQTHESINSLVEFLLSAPWMEDFE